MGVKALSAKNLRSYMKESNDLHAIILQTFFCVFDGKFRRLFLTIAKIIIWRLKNSFNS